MGKAENMKSLRISPVLLGIVLGLSASFLHSLHLYKQIHHLASFLRVVDLL